MARRAHSRHWLLMAGLACHLSWGSWCLGQENEAESPPRAASRMLSVIDAVVEHHLQPPARQQLVLEAARMLAQRYDLPIDGALSERVSATADSDELKAILHEKCAAAATSGTLRVEELHEILNTLMQSVSGGSFITTAREHAVTAQVASNRYVGTGIQLGMENGRPVMRKVFRTGPADQAGAQDGDVIESIDGQSTEAMDIRQVVDLLRGPAGSDVDVSLRQPSAAKARDYTITRGVVPIPTVISQTLTDDKRAIVIQIGRIASSTVHELRRIETGLDRATEVVVLDLRNLQNGDLHNSVLLASALLDGGKIGAVQRRTETRTHMAERGALFADRRLFAAVNQRTLGTPEWIAAALQDNGRARVVGQPTQGFGFVSDGVPTGVGDLVVVVTTGRLTRPAGGSLTRPLRRAMPIPILAERGGVVPLASPAQEQNGVTPDWAIPSSDRVNAEGRLTDGAAVAQAVLEKIDAESAVDVGA